MLTCSNNYCYKQITPKLNSLKKTQSFYYYTYSCGVDRAQWIGCCSGPLKWMKSENSWSWRHPIGVLTHVPGGRPWGLARAPTVASPRNLDFSTTWWLRSKNACSRRATGSCHGSILLESIQVQAPVRNPLLAQRCPHPLKLSIPPRAPALPWVFCLEQITFHRSELSRDVKSPTLKLPSESILVSRWQGKTPPAARALDELAGLGFRVLKAWSV